MLGYEREHWRYTDGGRQVVDRFFEDWTTRWFPRARRLGRQILLASMGEDLRAVLRLEAPSRPIQRLLRAGARAHLPLTLVRPLRSDRSWLDLFRSSPARHGRLRARLAAPK